MEAIALGLSDEGASLEALVAVLVEVMLDVTEGLGVLFKLVLEELLAVSLGELLALARRLTLGV